MIFMATIISFSISRLIALAWNKNSILRSNRSYTDPSLETNPHYVGNKGFNIGFRSNSFGMHRQSNMLTNTSLFDFSIQEFSMSYQNNTNGYTITTEDKGTGLWKVDDFDYPGNALTVFNIDTYICPNSKEYKIKGGIASNSTHYLNMTLSRWRDKSDCLTDDQIDEVLDQQQLILNSVIQTYYFDSDDYDNPLKPYFVDSLQWYLTSGFSKSIRIDLQEYKFIDNNDITGIQNNSEYEYYSVK